MSSGNLDYGLFRVFQYVDPPPDNSITFTYISEPQTDSLYIKSIQNALAYLNLINK